MINRWLKINYNFYTIELSGVQPKLQVNLKMKN